MQGKAGLTGLNSIPPLWPTGCQLSTLGFDIVEFGLGSSPLKKKEKPRTKPNNLCKENNNNNKQLSSLIFASHTKTTQL